MTKNPAAVYRVQVLDERLAADRLTLAALRSDPRNEVVDLLARQRREVESLLPQPGGELLNEPPRWIYYPWRRTIASIVGPESFRTLRLDRNRNKITQVEQDRFRKISIGIVGLSVGHAIAHTLALEGLFGEIRLVDNEAMKTTDLNRIPATTLDVSVNKAIVTARRIAEVDPYLAVDVITSEFTHKVCNEFMDGLDIVLEESYSLQTKVLVRETAKNLRLPVVMAASNRGLLDIERYDLEPTRPTFHNLLGNTDVLQPPHGKQVNPYDYLFRLLETEEFSPRLIATRAELGRTLSDWPQLGGELQLAGATVCATVRRIVLGPALLSGRVRLDLDDHLEKVRDPARQGKVREVDSSTRQSLDVLVTKVAVKLMGVDLTTMVPLTLAVLAELRDFFRVDHVSLRHNHRAHRTATLVAEWPMQEVVLDVDSNSVLDYRFADEWDAPGEYALEPRVGRHAGRTRLAVPLIDGGESLGFLTFSTSDDWTWAPAAVDSVTAIAALFATLKKRLEAEDLLRYIAAHDHLTDLSNRRALLEYMEGRFRSGMPGPVATMFIDLDRLKSLNDFIGHSAGDEFIRTVAARLREYAEPDDMIARLGGDEFVVIPAVQLDADGAQAAAEQIQSLIGERVDIGGERVSRSVSIGVAVCTPGEVSVSDVLRQADQAMLAAKSSGGNGISFFTDEMRSERELRDDIELHLRHAVETDTLLLHYQPEVDLRTGRILAVEALVRWNHPTRGLLYPNTFIEIAEATNVAGELGRWVIRHACEQLALWRSNGIAKDVVMRINVSPVQLVSLDFVESVKRVLEDNHLDGSAVCFEITEHVVVQDLQRTRVTLSGLRQIGAAVAIDDFGTGHSSLTHLKELDVNALKIDHGFVTSLGYAPNDLAIVKSVVGLAKSLDLEIIAEGVETPVAARTLLTLGCWRAQGFLISRPIPPRELETALSAGVIPLSFVDV